jgi:hypothetical protein
MKKEMIKFVSENFEVIKSKFYDQERDLIVNDYYGDEDEDADEIEVLLDYLDSQIEDANSAEELIDVINERSLGVDYDDEDDAQELFDMIKALKEAAN